MAQDLMKFMAVKGVQDASAAAWMGEPRGSLTTLYTRLLHF